MGSVLLDAQSEVARSRFEPSIPIGYRHTEAALLLNAFRALALRVAPDLASVALKADLYRIAMLTQVHLVRTLGSLVLSRADVEDVFVRLRTERSAWPTSIDEASWRLLERERVLRDVSDVVLSGGDYWEAIQIALEDVFGLEASS